ncbi:MAG TPA: 5'-nucleotidase C-terminal domain-containing protein [Chryseosolibacter sp.]|nr:5'-nucleotidase C-terminal domain-containing protein [Chryseosolibacter sp.]
MDRRYLALLISWSALFLITCTPSGITYRSQQYALSAEQGGGEPAFERMIAPYRDSLDQSMSAPLAYSSSRLVRPVCGNAPSAEQTALVNFIADVWFKESTEAFMRETRIKPDFFLSTCGSVRGSLPQGTVTLGNVYELMPFDNYFVLVKLDHGVMADLFRYLAASDSNPVAGISMSIKDGKASDVLIAGKSYDSLQSYFVAISSYHATGGDNMPFFNEVKEAHPIELLFRDALINALTEMQHNGDTIKPDYEHRIKK